MEQAPATKPAAEALPALVMPFAPWVTWLEGVVPLASGRMCGLPSVPIMGETVASLVITVEGKEVEG